jgi:hypothetical protein
MRSVKWVAIVVGAAILALAVGAYALTARGGGQRLRDIVPTTKPAGDDQAGDDADDQAGDNEAGDDSDDQAGDGRADGP